MECMLIYGNSYLQKCLEIVWIMAYIDTRGTELCDAI